MGNRKSIIREALDRLDSLMAIGESRAEAKAQARARGETIHVGFSTEHIHSFKGRGTYQPIILRFLRWCRATFGLNRLQQVDARADELASRYLQERLDQGKSAWTLKTERSALRLFFQQRTLTEAVALPKRRRQEIQRSRHPAARDHFIQEAHWQPLICFLLACGLRREEVQDLRVRDVWPHPEQGLIVEVRRGKGGKRRCIPVFPGREQDVLTVVALRPPEERVFVRLPSALDIQHYRRRYAQEYYAHLAGVSLPLQFDPKRSFLSQLNREAALQVSRALGHNRLDVLQYYLIDN